MVGVKALVVRAVLSHVAFFLVEALKLMVQYVNSDQPLYRGHSVPAGYQQAQGKAMVERQRLAVHFIGQHRIRIGGFVQGQAPLVGYIGRVSDGLIRAVVGSLEHYLYRVGFQAGPGQQVGQGHSGPFRIAHDAVTLNLLHNRAGAGGPGPVIGHRAIAAALKSDLKTALRHLQQLIKGQAQRLFHRSIHHQPVGSQVNFWGIRPVVADIEEVVGYHVLLQRLRGRGPGTQPGVGGD